MDVAEGILLVAVGCGRLSGILDISAKRPFVVFGTLDAQVLGDLAVCLGDAAREVPVYFYETG